MPPFLASRKHMPVTAMIVDQRARKLFAGSIKMVHKWHLLHGTDLRVGRSIQMLDFLILAIGLGFFVLSIGYAHACDRL
jgi:hypothetical protein